MTNHQTHADMRNHCNHATITNHFSQAIYDNHIPHSTHDKQYHQCYKWEIILPFAIHDKLFPPFHTWKKNIRPMSHDKPLQLCHHQKPFLPCNPWQTISPILPWQITSTMTLMRAISHLQSLKTMGPIPPGQTISPLLPITNDFTYSIHDIPFISKFIKVFHPPNVSLQRRDISRSLLFWRWLGSCRYRFVSLSPLSCLWITKALHLVKSIWIYTASGSTHVVVVWFTWLAICCLVWFQPLKELSVVCLILPLKLNSQTQT